MFQIENIPYNDEKTWDLICSGLTRGTFQLESPLMRHWVKRIKPRNIWELSAVISLVRPGPLQSSMTDNYVASRDGKKTFESFGHPIIDEVFNTTEHVLCYQEQVLSLGARLAWKDLDEKQRLINCDLLRKSISKKDQKKVLEIGKEFVSGCVKNGVDQAVSDKLFEIIKNCGRYLFNLSHSISYATVGYQTAYLKAHYPQQFLAVYLSYAKFKQSKKYNGKETGGKWGEISDFVNESKILGTEILPPNVNCKNDNFCIEGDSIRYGLSHIKYFGSKTIVTIQGLNVTINDWRQALALCCTDRFGKQLGSKPSEALIVTGAFIDCKVSRSSLLNAYNCIMRMTDREIKFLFDHLETLESPSITSLPQAIIDISGKATGKRKDLLKSEAQILNVDAYDNPAWVELQEQQYLGIGLTACAVEDKVSDNIDRCIDCSGNFPDYTKKNISVVIDEVRYTVTKNGKTPGAKMCFISVHDNSGQLIKLPVFPEKFEKIEDILMEKNTISLCIVKGKGGWFVESAYQL